jgi:hypothetical protein
MSEMVSPDTEPDEKPEPFPGYATDLHVTELTAAQMDLISAAIGAQLGFYVVEEILPKGQEALVELFVAFCEKVASLDPMDA